MAYEVFCKRVEAIAKNAGIGVKFLHKNGLHVAYCSDGVTITANAVSARVCVRWGSGHTSYATI